MNIYVGNLPQDASEADVQQTFQTFGQVASVTIIKDKYGVSRGYAFVEMPVPAEAQAAILGLKGHVWKGRPLNVHKAQPLSAGRRSGEKPR